MAGARRTREQLLGAISLSSMTVFTVDRNRKVTMLEGALVHRDQTSPSDKNESKWYIGQDLFDVFDKLKGQRPPFLALVDSMLAGRAVFSIKEDEIGAQYSAKLPCCWVGFVDAAKMAVRFGVGLSHFSRRQPAVTRQL
jgi:hypothetical protein